jgi:Cu2+-exporting ATPase
MNQPKTEHKDQHDAHIGTEPMLAATKIQEGHAAYAMSEHPVGHDAHAGHDKSHTDHTGNEQMFRTSFWICLVLSIPVLIL